MALIGVKYGVAGSWHRPYRMKAEASPRQLSDWDRALAKFSVRCLVCNLARRKQTGFVYWLVKTVERKICPFCRAYERVYGRKSHEPFPPR